MQISSCRSGEAERLQPVNDVSGSSAAFSISTEQSDRSRWAWRTACGPLTVDDAKRGWAAYCRPQVHFSCNQSVFKGEEN